MKPRLLGIVGFKNAGKTTLIERLVAELTSMDYLISTIKHAHHGFDIDHEGRDSWRHRHAGACEVGVVSASRWALVHELRGKSEPTLAEVVAKFSPCDLILTEGYKWEQHPKIEVRNLQLDHPRLAEKDSTIIAVVANGAIADCPVSYFDREDMQQIAQFVVDRLGLRR